MKKTWLALAALAVPWPLAAGPKPETAPELRGTGWVNAQEYSIERLRGKIVFLYFYEEG